MRVTEELKNSGSTWSMIAERGNAARKALANVFRRPSDAAVVPVSQVAVGSFPYGSSAGAPTDPIQASRFVRAWDFYNGRFPASLTVRPGQADDNLRVNFCKVIADKGAGFLFGQDISFDIAGEDEDTAEEDADREAAEQWLVKVWSRNKQMSLLHKAALNGAATGHVFIKIVPQAGALYGAIPKLVVLNSSMVGVEWAPDDMTEITRYVIQWTAVDTSVTGKSMEVRQIIERDNDPGTPDIVNTNHGKWRVIDQQRPQGEKEWHQVAVTNWPYDFAPIVDCQSLPAPNDFWGMADLTDDIMDIQRQINFVLTNINRILRYYAHPKTWASGMFGNAVQAIDFSPGQITGLPGENAKLHNLEMQSDLSSSIKLYEELRSALRELSRTPEVATGAISNLGPLSGLALQVLYQPLLEKTSTKRRLYGDMLEELNKRLLFIANPAWDYDTTIKWPDLLPEDDLASAQKAQIWESLGVSKTTTLQKLGFDPELEKQNRADEAQDGAEAGQAALEAFNQGRTPGWQQQPGIPAPYNAPGKMNEQGSQSETAGALPGSR